CEGGRGRCQYNKFRRRRRQEKDWRWGWRRERIDWIVEHQNRPLNVDNFLGRRRWHVVSHRVERGRWLQGDGEKSEPATGIGRVRSARISPQVRPIGVRCVDEADAAPGFVLPSPRADCADTCCPRTVG